MTTWQHQLIPLKTLASGDQLHLALYTITSPHPGPQVYLQSSMHAAELQGQGVLFHLMQFLAHHDFCGTIQIIAPANPLGAQQKILTHTLGRFNFLTGNNWNRNYLDLKEHLNFSFSSFVQQHRQDRPEDMKAAFKQAYAQALQDFLANPYGISDEQKLAVILQSYACKADIVIDLHNAWAGTYYLYATEDDPYAKAWGIPFIIRLPYHFAGALDEASFMPWYHLAQACAAEGRPLKFDFASYTVELASEESFSFAQSQQDLAYLLRYLAARGVVAPEDVPPLGPADGKIWESKLCHFKTYYAPQAGLIDFKVAPGTIVAPHDVLAQYLTWPSVDATATPVFAPVEQAAIKARQAAVVLNHANSNLAQEGQMIIQVLENLRPVN
ncbi:MAG: succinylglutamate desuccinylase/aspartoacylase family protein [Bacteriovoracaceae bacterium]|nr:succinylglutamate desuccinylase/aspartoacylase family protein [Bacteriovoracaceae bacterium]